MYNADAMNRRLHICQLLTAFTLLFSAIQAHAEQWYQVELVVFEQLATVTDEQWPKMTELPTASLTPASASQIIQPAKTDTLRSVVSKLQRSPQYKVDYYQAWKQPILNPQRAKAVGIHSEKDLIDGSIRLYKETYLHVELNLWLKQQDGQVNSWSDASPEGVDIGAPRNPHLQQERRIRSSKLFYFDNPKIGALLEITPVSTPAAAIDDIKKPESYSLPAETKATVSQ